MKKKLLTLTVMLVISLVTVTSCSKKLDPTEAMTVYINSYMYGKDTEKMQEFFAVKVEDTSKEDQTNFINLLKEQFQLNSDYDKKLEDLYKTYQENLKKNTSFTTSVLDERDNKVKMEVTIKGLKEINVDKIEEEIAKKIEENPDLIKDDMTEGESNRIISQLAFEVYAAHIESNTEKKEPVTLKVTLEENTDKKGTWKIKGEDEFFKKLNVAIGV